MPRYLIFLLALVACRQETKKEKHGQSRLIFISGKDTLSFMMNSNKDFPAAIDSNKLYFPQTKERVGIEILRDVICVGPGGCINKEDTAPRFDDLSTVQADSIEQIFRGEFPKE